MKLVYSFTLTAGVEWDGMSLLDEDFGLADCSSPRTQTPPSGVANVSTDANGMQR